MPDVLPPTTVKTPLPRYMGSKARIAADVWLRFGDITHYVEPFAGSAAVLFARPGRRTGYRETINDASGLIVNALRSCRNHPTVVAEWVKRPGSTLDLEAAWRASHDAADDLPAKLRADPYWCDPDLGGMFVYGAGWVINVSAFLSPSHRPGRPLSAASALSGATVDPDEALRLVAARLRRCVILCGDWAGPVTDASVGATDSGWSQRVGVFMDPPYDLSQRHGNLYHVDDDGTAARAAVEWARVKAEDSRWRIAVCGQAGEHSSLVEDGWEELAWSSTSGSRHLERVWFSPGCYRPPR